MESQKRRDSDGDDKSRVFVTSYVGMESAKRGKFVTVRSGVLTEIQKVFLPKIYKKYYYQT